MPTKIRQSRPVVAPVERLAYTLREASAASQLPAHVIDAAIGSGRLLVADVLGEELILRRDLERLIVSYRRRRRATSAGCPQ
jgi:hypothetical protein